jgi:hypothetical protein
VPSIAQGQQLSAQNPLTVRVSRLACYPSSVPLPASACEPPPPPPPDVLGPIEVPALPPCQGSQPKNPDSPRSLVFNKLLKKFCSTSCYVCPVGLGTPPARLPPQLPPPSISASARSTAGSEKVDEACGGNRGVDGAAEMPRGSRSARRAFSS